ncbi:hypothetical protein EVAR_38068_1 [Eumeta japonica]|uniref:Uncharacterized protein n=1 Tax=Eumeta variegata TaxID=151549 RepID=A0A4C1WAY9_EUMVA|nr:hypothetical protein EVAR_38068_1 [Eumeta japonica]
MQCDNAASVMGLSEQASPEMHPSYGHEQNKDPLSQFWVQQPGMYLAQSAADCRWNSNSHQMNCYPSMQWTTFQYGN